MALGSQPLFEPGETSLIVDLGRASHIVERLVRAFGLFTL